MLRWLVRASVAGSANSDVKSESSKASRKANDAKRQFDYAKRERDLDKKFGRDGLSDASRRLSKLGDVGQVEFQFNEIIRSGFVRSVIREYSDLYAA